MRKIALISLLGMTLAVPCSSVAAEVDWTAVDKALGKTAAVQGDVHRYGIPRSDLKVKVDGVTIKPALALGGWVAFEPAKDGTMLMGDIVLTENEVTPVMTNLLQSGIEITALHNHLMRSTPATFYMHIRGHGDPESSLDWSAKPWLKPKRPSSRRQQPRPKLRNLISIRIS